MIRDFLPLDGGSESGVSAVLRSYDTGAKAFRAGGTGRFDVLQSASSGALAFWTGHRRAHVNIQGKEDAVAMLLRTTEVFRFEESGWKLVHRHADRAKEPPE